MAESYSTDAHTSAVMRRIKCRDTEPEKLLRKALWRKGLRYRTCDGQLPGKPDIVFSSQKLAVFVDGDYWHGNQWRMRGLVSLEDQFQNVRNGKYWVAKIRGNIHRDFATTATLLDDGWTIIRLWESDIKAKLNACVELILKAINGELASRRSTILCGRTVAEFFAGIGLVRLGLDASGWGVVYANDIDETKQAMYEANFGGEDFHRDDVHLVPSASVAESTLFTASFPCNDLSVAGARAGLEGEQSSAFWGFYRILDELGEKRPPFILLENVPGFLTSHNGRDFQTVLLALTKLGYVCDAFMLNAMSFVPQSRARLFVVGKVARVGCTTGTFGPSEVRPKRLIEFINSHPNIDWDLWALPDPPHTSKRLESIVEDLPADSPEWWNDKRTKYFMGQISDRHMRIVSERIRAHKYSYATAFRRVRQGRSMAELRFDGIAGCLRTPRGGSGRQILFKAGCGEYQVRLLTPRECARLQGVADDYKIVGSTNQALFGFGDAVCVPVIEWIADHYFTPIASMMIHGTVLSLNSPG